MRSLILATVLAVGCGGAGDARLSDGEPCASNEQCAGDTPLDDVAPGVRITSVSGRCYLGACATQYESAGWRCVVVAGAPTCWKID